MNNLKIILKNIKENYILYSFYSILLILWLILIYFGIITYYRLILFFIVLFYIYFYRIILLYFENLNNKNYKIKNEKIIYYMIMLNRYKNPLLSFILFIEEKIFDILCKYEKDWLKKISYIIFIFLINPLMVLLFKFYGILFTWKNTTFFDIIVNRLIGLLLSVLIFTNIIYILTKILGFKFWFLIYIYLFIVALLSEYNNRDECKNKYLYIFLVPDFTIYNIVHRKLGNNIISYILKYNNIDLKKEILYYINFKNDNKINIFKIGKIRFVIKNIKNFKNKPGFNLYFYIKNNLGSYLILIKDHLLLEINNWKLPKIENLDGVNILEITDTGEIIHNLSLEEFKEIIKEVKIFREFDFIIFKLLLFMSWDFDSYLGLEVKDSLIIEGPFLSFTFKNFDHAYGIDEKEYIEKIKDINDKILSFDNKVLIKLDPYFLSNSSFIKKDEDLMEIEKKYRKMFMYFETLVRMWKENDLDDLEIRKKKYEGYIMIWYEEWKGIKNKEEYYKEEFNKLEKQFKILFCFF